MPSEPNIEAALKRLKRAEGITKSIWPSGFSENSSAGTLTREIRAAIADLTPKRYYVSVNNTTRVNDRHVYRSFTASNDAAATWLVAVLNAAEDKT